MATSDQPAGTQFTTTHWSAVLTARDKDSPQAQAALSERCRTYWYPLCAYVRRRGRSPTPRLGPDDLAHCSLVGKEAFLGGFKPRGRRSSRTVCVLNRTPESLLRSTVVTLDATPPAPNSFTNIRLFAKEEGLWKCRMWMNFPGNV